MIPNKNQPKNLTNLSDHEEIKIPVPWGHISGKKYKRLTDLPSDYTSTDKNQNFNKSLPVLCFHGWLDNAGTFNRLIPLIQQVHPDIEFLSFDFPGHGLSSHRPDGVYTNSSIYITDISRIATFLKLDDSGFNAMGHSMGANALCQYVSVFPNKIKSLIRIESEGYVQFGSLDQCQEKDLMNRHLKRTIEAQLNYDFSKQFNPREKNQYTFKQAKERLLKGTTFMNTVVPSSVDEDTAHIMIERGLKEIASTYTDLANEPKTEIFYSFTRDVKLIMPSVPFYTKEIGDNLLESGYQKSSHNEILIQANKNCWHDFNYKICKNPNNFYKDQKEGGHVKFCKQNPNFHLVCVEGNHHLHLNHPEVFIEKLNRWIGDVSDKSFSISGEELRSFRTSEELIKKFDLKD